MIEKKDIRNLTFNEVLNFCLEHGLAKYRAEQIWTWIWKKRATSFNEITSLSKKNRELLNKKLIINPAKIHKVEKSYDGTRKYSFELFDKLLVEGVLIPAKNRLTACISSQVGCSLACDFCATGTLKLARNISYAEIYDQVFILNEEAKAKYGKPISNIVYMGMGEPLLNYNAVMKSIDFITNKKGLSMSAKRITVSTAGIAKFIRKLGDDNVKFNLAISLHSANNDFRNDLMPINKKIDLAELREAVKYFFDKTGHRVTYEYILFKNLNDSIRDAQELFEFAKISPCKINLIEYNKVDGIKYEKSTNKAAEFFIKYLKEKSLIVNLRRSKGHDIAAACGQLVNKLK